MALNAQYSNAAVNAAVDALAALLNSGYLRLYTTPQAADANTALGAQTLLAELRFGATAFASAVAGVATANAITSDTDADATGAAVWYRCLKSDGTTVVCDGTKAPIVTPERPSRAELPKRIKRPAPVGVAPEPEPWQPAKVMNVTDEEEELLLALL